MWKNMKKYVETMEKYKVARSSPLYTACETWENSELRSLYVGFWDLIWDLENSGLSHLYGLSTLRKPKIKKAKRDIKHVSIGGSVTGILFLIFKSEFSNLKISLWDGACAENFAKNS